MDKLQFMTSSVRKQIYEKLMTFKS